MIQHIRQLIIQDASNVEHENTQLRALDESLLPHNNKDSGNAAATSGASLLSSVASLANTTLGAGIVAIPYFFSQCGILLGIAILVSIGLVSAYASILLVEAAERSSSWTYMDLATAAYDKRGLICAQSTILALTLGVLSAFFVELGEVAEELLSEDQKWWGTAPVIKLALGVVVLIPLGLQKSLAGLANFSLIVVASIVYLVAIVCFLGGYNKDDDSNSSDVKMVSIGSKFFTALPIIVLSFGNQVNVQQVVTEMRQPTASRIRTLIVSTNLLVSAMYLVIGITGYYRFGSDTKDNIISNYHGFSGTNASLFSVARVGILLIVLFSYPMLLHPCRTCLNSVLGIEQPSYAVFAGETIVIIGFTWFVSIVVPALGTIMGYTGAIAGTLLGFIYPAAFHLKLVPEHKGPAGVILMTGIMFAIACFGAQVAIDAGA